MTVAVRRWLALVVGALGVAVLVGLPQIGAGAGYDRIGPRVFPAIVAGGLLLLGASLAVFGGRPAAADPAAPAPAPSGVVPMLYLGTAGLVFLVLVERAGFVIAAAAQFWLVARAFRSRRPVRDLIVAVLLAAAVYAGFSIGLGLALPQGPLDSLF
jgi:putative tricarboxylic transport membrane protein